MNMNSQETAQMTQIFDDKGRRVCAVCGGTGLVRYVPSAGDETAKSRPCPQCLKRDERAKKELSYLLKWYDIAQVLAWTSEILKAREAEEEERERAWLESQDHDFVDPFSESE